MNRSLPVFSILFLPCAAYANPRQDSRQSCAFEDGFVLLPFDGAHVWLPVHTVEEQRSERDITTNKDVEPVPARKARVASNICVQADHCRYILNA